jgi:hypothetical protein
MTPIDFASARAILRMQAELVAALQRDAAAGWPEPQPKPPKQERQDGRNA